MSPGLPYHLAGAQATLTYHRRAVTTDAPGPHEVNDLAHLELVRDGFYRVARESTSLEPSRGHA
jgi:hypothetical protein